MVRVLKSKEPKTPLSYLLVEGETDKLFWQRVRSDSINNCRVMIKDLKGLFNINKKVINGVIDYTNKHVDEVVKIYCCLDRESRYGKVPEFDIKTVIKYIRDQGIKRVLSVDQIIATQQTECWFLYDIEGIFKFWSIPKSKRNPKAFQPPEKCTFKDLKRLARRYSRDYEKGDAAMNFINHLDIGKIILNCRELREGIEKIKSNAEDLTNHLFRIRSRENKL